VKRDFDQLDAGPFDLLVLGGGIYGAWTAYDAALRGLRVALVERDDWAMGTSSASSKLIHGGLRYLEHAELGLVRKTLDERRRLCRLGPHRVRPLRFLMPVYRGDRVGRARLRVGLWFYDRLAGRDQPVAPHRALAARELLGRVALEPHDLRGGFSFGDCVTDDARLVVEIVDGAWRAGATALNRAAARRLRIERGRVVGAAIEDRETGRTTEVRALATVASVGPWIAELTAAAGAPVATRLAKGVHLVLPSVGLEEAIVLSSNDDARIVFLIPWYGRTLLGTTDTDHRGDPGDVRVTDEDVAYLLERSNRVLRAPRWGAGDVIASFAGLRTLPSSAASHPSRVTREWSLVEPAEGLFVPVGGKLTSARADASRIVDRVVRRMGWSRVRPAPTLERPFPWAPTGPFDAWLERAIGAAVALGLDVETARHCALRHGSRLDEVLAHVRDAPDLGRRVVAGAPFCRAEAVHAAREEMARSLGDVLRRRLPLLLLAPPDAAALRDAAELVGRELGWDDGRRRDEVAALSAGAPGVPAP
jgi:glycerol-3-phosphate dehydrogenase